MTVHRGDLAVCGERARRDRSLGRDPEGARHLVARSRARACDPLRRERFSGRAARRLRLGRDRSPSSATARAPRAIICSTDRRRRKATSSSCPRSAATLKAIAKDGPRAFYEGPIARGHGRDAQRQGLGALARRLRQASRRGADADLDQLSRPRSRRNPAEQAGPHRAGDAQHPREFRSGALDALGPERFHLLLEAARLGFAVRDTHIAEPSFMRVPTAALNDKAFAKTARREDRPQQARAAAHGADAGQRHRLSHGGRPRPQGGVVHQLAVFRRSAPPSAPKRPA